MNPSFEENFLPVSTCLPLSFDHFDDDDDAISDLDCEPSTWLYRIGVQSYPRCIRVDKMTAPLAMWRKGTGTRVRVVAVCELTMVAVTFVEVVGTTQRLDSELLAPSKFLLDSEFVSSIVLKTFVEIVGTTQRFDLVLSELLAEPKLLVSSVLSDVVL